MLQTSYTKTPYVFLSAEHSVKGVKHDAATVWVENVNTKGFQACLRELQNFDGLHENITVVSWTVHWSRDDSLSRQSYPPIKIFSCQNITNFL